MRRHLESGDLIFRKGNPKFKDFIGTDYTHCGIMVDSESIHDLYNFGLRNVSVEQFVDESSDKEEFEIFRPNVQLFSIDNISQLIDRIKSGKSLIPTTPKPWNVFSAWGDYESASCVKYCLYNYFSLLDKQAKFEPTYIGIDMKYANMFIKFLSMKTEYCDEFNNCIEVRHIKGNKYPIAIHSSLIGLEYFHRYHYKTSTDHLILTNEHDTNCDCYNEE